MIEYNTKCLIDRRSCEDMCIVKAPYTPELEKMMNAAGGIWYPQGEYWEIDFAFTFEAEEILSRKWGYQEVTINEGDKICLATPAEYFDIKTEDY